MLEMFAEYSRKRREAFNNLSLHLIRIKLIVKSIDGAAKIYLFGSVAKGTNKMASDIDLLNSFPALVISS